MYVLINGRSISFIDLISFKCIWIRLSQGVTSECILFMPSNWWKPLVHKYRTNPHTVVLVPAHFDLLLRRVLTHRHCRPITTNYVWLNIVVCHFEFRLFVSFAGITIKNMQYATYIRLHNSFGIVPIFVLHIYWK